MLSARDSGVGRHVAFVFDVDFPVRLAVEGVLLAIALDLTGCGDAARVRSVSLLPLRIVEGEAPRREHHRAAGRNHEALAQNVSLDFCLRQLFAHNSMGLRGHHHDDQYSEVEQKFHG